ncbi:unnamed protein product [marine sediment metagenome]|uniref:PIN domain-containing protein n=1 Tax=marine sediment metagenome TaxID=412755 RepID=X0Z5T6_9ZZZZ
MLKYSKENINGKIAVKIDQIAYPPTVYLDTWALFDFIEDDRLANKFIKILNNLGGTLMLSIMSVLESVGLKNQKQFQCLCDLIDSLGIDKVALLDFNFMRVSTKEKIYKKISPAIDCGLLDSFIKIHKPENPLKVSEIFSAYQQDLENGKVLEENWEQSLFPIILRARNNTDSLSNAKKRFRKRKEKAKTCKFPCTEFLWESCIDYIAINENMKMPDKEWRDIFHTIVPVAYCDFVLIDKRWRNFVKSTGLNPPQIAKVYAQRNLSEFLRDLENWKRSY